VLQSFLHVADQSLSVVISCRLQTINITLARKHTIINVTLTDVKKRSNKNFKNLKNVKNVTKINNVCKRNKHKKTLLLLSVVQLHA